MEKEKEKTRIKDRQMLLRMTERETIERSDLNVDTVINAMNQQYTNKLNEMDAEYANKERALATQNGKRKEEIKEHKNKDRQKDIQPDNITTDEVDEGEIRLEEKILLQNIVRNMDEINQNCIWDEKWAVNMAWTLKSKR